MQVERKDAGGHRARDWHTDGSAAARLHQSIVHTGRAIDTCDVEIGPRYRLSQLFGTRVLTSQSSSAPTSRPHAACGNARPRLSAPAAELLGRR